MHPGKPINDPDNPNGQAQNGGELKRSTINHVMAWYVRKKVAAVHTSQFGAAGLAMDAVTVAGELVMWRPSMVALIVYTPACIATYWKHAAPCFMPAGLTLVRLGPSTVTCTQCTQGVS